MEIALVLGLLVTAIILFWRETFSVDVTTVILLIALVVTGILKPDEAFAGFSGDIIIVLASVFIIGGAVQRTGVIDAVAARLLRYFGHNQTWVLLSTMIFVCGISAFMNNTTVTALFMPPVLGVARKLKVSPSKFLMPLAYASILGGTCTLIGTSTNIAVSSYVKTIGLEPIGLFEMTPAGLIIVAIGITYMMTIGLHLLPNQPADESLTEEFAIREYVSEILVLNDSQLIGQKVGESDLARLDFQIVALIRAKKKQMPSLNTVIKGGDVLMVRAKVEELMKVKKTAGIEIVPEFKLDDPALQGEDIKIAEVLVPPRSDLIGWTLKEANFRQRWGLTVLALYRHGRSIREKIKNVRLRLGDLLLVQGSPDRIDYLRRSQNIAVLEELNPSLYRKNKGLLAIAFLGAAIALSTFDLFGNGPLPLSIALLGAAVLTIVAGCLRMEEAYNFIDWRLLILIGGMTAFGKAMEKTGAAEFLAEQIVYYLRPLGAKGIMAGFFVLTIFLTQPMSNAAAALVVLPVALDSAQQLGASERSFAMAILFAASISFVTPFEPSCIIVYGPGKYRFSDFIKTGFGLTAILAITIYFLVPAFWPLYQ